MSLLDSSNIWMFSKSNVNLLLKLGVDPTSLCKGKFVLEKIYRFAPCDTDRDIMGIGKIGRYTIHFTEIFLKHFNLDLEAKDYKGRTPFELLLSGGIDDVVKLECLKLFKRAYAKADPQVRLKLLPIFKKSLDASDLKWRSRTFLWFWKNELKMEEASFKAREKK